MNAAELKSRLVGQAQSVVEHLLPAGVKKGGEWCVGSTAGEAGQSLKVHLQGDRAGVWSDFGGGGKGDILDLWQAVRGCNFPEACKQARGWLGIADGPSEDSYRKKETPKVYVAPDLKLVKQMEAGGPVFDYLTKKRKLDPATLTRYRVRQTDSYADFGATVIFPCFAPGETKTPDLLKYLAVKRLPGGKKQIAASPGARPGLAAAGQRGPRWWRADGPATSSAGTGLTQWPISPARCWSPCNSWPFTTTPAAMPERMPMQTKFHRPRPAPNHNSASAIERMLFSKNTGTPNRSVSRAPSGTLFQPRMDS